MYAGEQRGNVPQKIHLRDFWSSTFCRVGGRFSSAILSTNNEVLRDDVGMDGKMEMLSE